MSDFIKNRNQKIIRDYNNGELISKITLKYKLDVSYVYQILKKNGIRLRHIIPCVKYIGIIFGYLKVLDIVINKQDDYRAIAKCICLNCSSSKDIRVDNLVRGIAKSCGCLSVEFVKIQNSGSKHNHFNGVEEISGDFIYRIKRHAKSRNLCFEVEAKDLWDLFIKQNKKCALSGMDIFFGRSNTSIKTASLDRINSLNGYTIDNIQWVHKDINKMKNSYSQEYFVNCCRRIYEYQLSKIKRFGNICQSILDDITKHHYRGRSANRKGFKDISGAYWLGILNGAKSRNMTLEIDVEQIWDLFVENGNFCAISGLPIYFGQTYTIASTASLDRINSDLGYISDNIQWVHKDINKMKMEFAQKYFFDICKLISENKSLSHIQNYDDYEMFLLSGKTKRED